MILEKQTEAHILQDGGTQDSVKMSLDLDSAQVLMQMLSKNLYSDAIGSTIRECASNALDSHRRAGVTDPIIVSLKATTQGTYEFAVEDFGIGLDADDVRNIISKYGKSTKRDSNIELGMMGLGFKAPLAYSSSFYFIARKNGMERKYMMYEGDEVNTIDLLYETFTTERNGVKVIVPVKYGWDKTNFIRKIKEQLAYFENVYFDVPNSDIDNSFNIVRHEYFQFSPLNENDRLHICLDNVYYPLDFEKVGIRHSIYCPVALRFSLTDGLFPTPNRESIRYTKEAVDVIKKRLSQAADYFIDKYNETVTEGEDAIAVLKHLRKGTQTVKFFGDRKFELNPFEEFATKKMAVPTIKGIKHLGMDRIKHVMSYLLEEYELKFSLQNRKLYSSNSRWSGFGINYLLDNYKDRKVYVYSDIISGKMKDYMRYQHTSYSGVVYFVKKNKPFKLGTLKRAHLSDYDNYIALLQLDKVPKDQWRTYIKEFQLFLNMITKTFIDLDKIEIPQSFLDSRKQKRAFAKVNKNGVTVRRKKLEGEISVKKAVALERTVFNSNSKLVSTTIQMKEAHKIPKLVVYGGTEHADLMDKWFKPFEKTVLFLVCSKRELTNLEGIDLHNWIKMEKFMEGEHRVFRRVATAYILETFTKEYVDVFKREGHMDLISTDISEKMKLIHDYVKKNNLYSDSALYEAIIEIAQKKNLLDQTIYPTYLHLKSLFEKLPFLKSMFSSMPMYASKNGIIEATRDLFKYYKQRIDWKHYNIQLNEDKIGTPMTEEVLNEIL